MDEFTLKNSAVAKDKGERRKEDTCRPWITKERQKWPTI